MAELSSTLVKGKVDITGKLKIKGKNVPSIYLNNELQEELKITVINGNLYIGDLAAVILDTLYGSTTITLNNGMSASFNVRTNHDSGQPEITTNYEAGGGDPIVFAGKINGYNLHSSYGYLYDFGSSINTAEVAYLYYSGSAYDAASSVGYNYGDPTIQQFIDNGFTLVGHVYLKDGKWYQDV